ncbi:hypothetical protein CGRA01v4_03524 [Colletotrichum graminicola]|nr:hypothetical protein CGRA01v4_03524 [Colletotrichum graminicola]
MAKGTVSIPNAVTEDVGDIGCWRSEVGTIFMEIGGRRSASPESGTGALDPGGDCVAAGQYGNCVLFGQINGRGVTTNPAQWTWNSAQQARKRAARGREENREAEAPANAAVSKCTQLCVCLALSGSIDKVPVGYSSCRTVPTSSDILQVKNLVQPNRHPTQNRLPWPLSRPFVNGAVHTRVAVLCRCTGGQE